MNNELIARLRLLAKGLHGRLSIGDEAADLIAEQQKRIAELEKALEECNK